MKKSAISIVLCLCLMFAETACLASGIFDFEGDLVGQPPPGFSAVQTNGGKVNVEQDTVFGKFVRLTANPSGGAADAHINQELVLRENYLIVQVKLRANDNEGNKKLLLRDKNAKFLELACFRDGKFGYLQEFPGGGEEPVQIGVVYDLEFILNLAEKTAEVQCGGRKLAEGVDLSKKVFQFDKITFRCQNGCSDGLSVLDVDDISIAQMQNVQDGLCVSEVWYEDVDGNRRTAVSPGPMQICRTVENRGNQEYALRQFTAVRKGDILLQAAVEPIRILPGERKNIRTKIQIPDAYLNGGELVAYLWDQEKMEPMSRGFVSEKGKAYYAPNKNRILEDFAQNGARRGRPWVVTEAERLRRIAETADPDMTEWRKAVLVHADNICKQTPVTYEIVDNRLLAVSRRVLERAQVLSVAYAATKDEKYKERLWRELSAAAQFPDWHPSHFLDTAEMTAAFAMGYDWMYDQWSAGEREVIRRAIIEKGLTPGLKCYRGELGSYGNWVKWDWNWNVVCNGGLAVGALAVMDTDPELAAEVISCGLESYQAMVGEFAPDGAWKEGPGYWHYTVQYMTYYMSSLQSALGTDYGYGDAQGVNRTAYYLIHMTGVDRTFNLNDSGDGKVSAAELFWLAERYGDPGISRYRLENIRKGFYRASAMDLIWYNPDNMTTENTLPLADKFRESEIALFRDSWDKTTLFAGIHGGPNNIPHGNLDAGTFVLDMLGQRFACDLGGDNYELDGYFDNGNRRWKYYRTRAEGHNTIILNPGSGPDQQLNSFSPIIKFAEGGSSPFAIVDTTSAQSHGAQSAERGLMLVQNRTGVVIRDEIRMKEAGEAYWFMHTQAKIENYGADNRSVILERNGKRIWVGILAGEGTFYDMEAKPLPSSPQSSQQNPNTGTRKLAIHRENMIQWNLTVAFLPLKDGEVLPEKIPDVPELAQWQ